MVFDSDFKSYGLSSPDVLWVPQHKYQGAIQPKPPAMFSSHSFLWGCAVCVNLKKSSAGIGPQLAKEADTAFIIHGLLRLAGSHRKQKLYASWFVEIWGYPAQPIYSCSIALMNWLVCSSNKTALGLIVENVFLVTIPLGSPAQPVLGLILYL